MQARTVYTSLRRRSEFSRVHTQGRRKGDALLQVRVLLRPTALVVQSPLRVGMIVSKKYGSAVERNRFKRVVRAAFRALAAELTPGWDVLVLPRAAHGVKMTEVLVALRQLLSALGVLQPAPRIPSRAQEEEVS